LKVGTLFPFGLFEKSREFEAGDLLLVWPARVAHRRTTHLVSGVEQADRGRPRQRDGSGDLAGLRELSEGEEARRIHWIKSAAVGRMIRVERERDDRLQYWLTLPTPEDHVAADRSCEETASLAHELLREGHEVGLSVARQQLRPGAGVSQERRILTALAWVGFEGERRT
jgi:uncharacterized protein (DUF58 family)